MLTIRWSALAISAVLVAFLLWLSPGGAGVALAAPGDEDDDGIITGPRLAGNTTFRGCFASGPELDGDADANWDADVDTITGALGGTGSWEAGNMTKLKNGKRADIEKCVNAAKTAAVGGDEFIFYFSGHGGDGRFPDAAEAGEGGGSDNHILIGDSAAGARDRITDDQLAAMLSGFKQSVTLVIVLDSCYSHTFFDGANDLGSVTQKNAAGGDVAAGPRVGLIAASSPENPTCSGGMTTRLADGLKKEDGNFKADTNKDGVVTAKEAADYAKAYSATGQAKCDTETPCPAPDHPGATFRGDAPPKVDNCPRAPNPAQEDMDGDGIGDPCDPDRLRPEVNLGEGGMSWGEALELGMLEPAGSGDSLTPAAKAFYQAQDELHDDIDSFGLVDMRLAPDISGIADESGEAHTALVMSWPGGLGQPASFLGIGAFDLVYPTPMDLAGTTLAFSILPPAPVWDISLELIDSRGRSCGWFDIGPAPAWDVVTIDPSAPVPQDIFDAASCDPEFDIGQVARIRLNESWMGNTRSIEVDPATGLNNPWNAWDSLRVARQPFPPDVAIGEGGVPWGAALEEGVIRQVGSVDEMSNSAKLFYTEQISLDEDMDSFGMVDTVLTPDLPGVGDPAGENHTALVMSWREGPEFPASFLGIGAWELAYPSWGADLSEARIRFSILPPVPVWDVSLELIDANGASRGWFDIGPAPNWAQVELDPNLPAVQPPFDAFIQDPGFDITRVVSIRLDESWMGDTLTVDVDPASGLNTPWNAWDSLQVIPLCGGLTPTIVGTPGNDVIVGTTGDDVIQALAGDDTVFGVAGNDIICGGRGNDQLNGGDGNDAMWGDAGNDTLSGNAGGDRLNGGAGNDKANGGPGDDALNGGPGGDTLNGSTDDDTLDGEDGRDKLNGGAGLDNLQGGDHDDALNGGTEDDTLNGGHGNDTLNAGAGADRMFGGFGDDILRGGTEADLGMGGPGNDQLDGGSGNDVLQGNRGDDALNGGIDGDSLDGGDGDDRLNGASGNDQLDGGPGNDTLNGGPGHDVLLGSGGDDTLNASDGADQVEGGTGNDVLNGGRGDDSLDGGAGNDRLNGGLGVDELRGGDGADRLFGNDGPDRLLGESQNDFLDGGDNFDNLDGGAGFDTCVNGEALANCEA